MYQLVRTPKKTKIFRVETNHVGHFDGLELVISADLKSAATWRMKTYHGKNLRGAASVEIIKILAYL